MELDWVVLLFLFLGPHPALLRDHSLLEGLKAGRVMGTEPRLAMCQVSTLLLALSLQLSSTLVLGMSGIMV